MFTRALGQLINEPVVCLFQPKAPGIWGVFLWEFSILSRVVFLVDSSLFSYFRFQMMAQTSQVSQSFLFCSLYLAWASTFIVLMLVIFGVCPSFLASWYIKGAFISLGFIPYWTS